MLIVADTHVHLYPCYDFGSALRHLALNLRGHASSVPASSEETVLLALLAERRDCRCFRELVNGRSGLSCGIESAPEADVVKVMVEGCDPVYLFAGRQIVTAERIEILALTTDLEIEDGLPARAVIDAVISAGGVPVVAWAPGKWFFQRGKLVAGLIGSSDPGRLLFGDTTLRPAIWGEPLLMRRARLRGFAVLAGSDPLPFAGEEVYMGRYVSVFRGDFDLERPVSSVRGILAVGGLEPVLSGPRCSLPEVLLRLRKNAAGG